MFCIPLAGKTTEGVEQPAVLRGVLKGLELLLSRAPPGIHPIDKHMLPTILHAWPGGGNSIREVAFLRVSQLWVISLPLFNFLLCFRVCLVSLWTGGGFNTWSLQIE